jgi:hypothetical protein
LLDCLSSLSAPDPLTGALELFSAPLLMPYHLQHQGQITLRDFVSYLSETETLKPLKTLYDKKQLTTIRT